VQIAAAAADQDGGPHKLAQTEKSGILLSHRTAGSGPADVAM
jgi:hypothetical protein